MPISVGPAPDQLAARAPASTRLRSNAGASGNIAVRAGWWMRSAVAPGDEVRRIGQAGQQQPHAAQIEDCVGP